MLRIVRAEDERRWDADLQTLLADKNAEVRRRAALAAGRIGDERAVPALISLLQKDSDELVRAMAAFGLGEIESAKAADALASELQDRSEPEEIRARSIEALGKIAAALPKTDETRARSIRQSILSELEFQAGRRSRPEQEIILLGLTAALRARPENAGKVIARFLGYSNSRVRADAANTLARLKLSDGNNELRKLLTSDPDPIVRANVARVLGATEDKASFDVLIDRAIKDDDLRVRVSSIRALSSLKDSRAADFLLERGMRILEKSSPPAAAKNELLEIASTLGSLLTRSKDPYVASWLRELRVALNFESPEVEIALARLDPAEYVHNAPKVFLHYKPSAMGDTPKGKQLYVSEQWRHLTNLARAMGEVARLVSKEDKENAQVRTDAQNILLQTIGENNSLAIYDDMDVPEVMRAYAAFKPEELSSFLRFKLGLESTNASPANNKDKRVLVRSDDVRIKGRYAVTGSGRKAVEYLTPPDVIISSTAAELLAELPPDEVTTQWLVESLYFALSETMNDAALAILDALAKQKSTAANDAIKTALDSSDHLIRRRAVALLKENGVGDFSSRIGTVQTRNTTADYERAIVRIGKQVRATVTTSKGSFVIEFLPEAAPLTVDNFVMLARKGFFNGQTVPRVVPNFVIQTGDPRGDQNGGPGYSIRCEINEVPYDRGAVGMALSGKDTGGSQWFVTHSPQPHLDGGYTVFGHVTSGMDVVDRIVRGEIIRSIIISESAPRASKPTVLRPVAHRSGKRG